MTRFDIKRAAFGDNRVWSLEDRICLKGLRPGKVDRCKACRSRHAAVCAGIPAETLNELAAIVANVDLLPGQALFEEGQPAGHIFIVTAGAMKVFKPMADGRRQITGFLHEGDFLGLAEDGRYAYSAEALTAATLCRFPRDKLERLFERFPDMERRMCLTVSNELVEAQDQLLLLGRKAAMERVATFLRRLLRRADRILDESMTADSRLRARRAARNADVITLDMTRGDIADFVGLTHETVSRAFSRLKRAGVIELLPHNRVQVLDRDKLAALAGASSGLAASDARQRAAP